MVTLNSDRFFSVQNKFYQQVLVLPVTLELFIESVVPADGDGYQQLMRSQKETFTKGIVHCLYRRNLSFHTRQKFGLTHDITALIHIPPKELVDKFGTFKLDHKKILARFSDLAQNEFYEVDQVIYLEPLFESCVAVQYHLKNVTKHIDINTLDNLEKTS